ncbi:tandem-95 repeat protein, partial [Magnetospirillum sp. SS-4]|uniref:cadherin-like domain-containing protein n=1 Tax=Magnetospirillum sp. SS-4 TaxID=2681465 RepID=UPI001573DAF5
MADTNDNANKPADHNTGTGDGAHQALDDLTVLQNVDSQTLGESRLNVARAADVGDTALGNLANVQQGSTSNPQVRDVGGIVGGVNVALDVAIETTQTSRVAPPDLGSAPSQAEENADSIEIRAEGVKPLNVKAFDDLARPDAEFRPQEVTAGEGLGGIPVGGVVTGGAPPAPPPAEEAPAPEEEIEQVEAVEEKINQAPVILEAESVSTVQEGRVSGRISASDPDGDALSFRLVDSDGNVVDSITNEHGSISIDPATGQYTFVASEATRALGLGDNVSEQFQVQVTDSQGASVTQSFSVTVNGLNDGPTTSAVDLADGAEDTAIILTQAQLLANAGDIDGDTLSVSAVSADHGTITPNDDGTFTFTPEANYNGPVSFSYTVSDGVDSTAGTATLDLAAVNDGPTTSAVDLAGGDEN